MRPRPCKRLRWCRWHTPNDTHKRNSRTACRGNDVTLRATAGVKSANVRTMMAELHSNKRIASSPITWSSPHYMTLQLGGQPGRLSPEREGPAPAVTRADRCRFDRLGSLAFLRHAIHVTVGIKLDPISAFHKSRFPMSSQCRTMAG